LLRRAFRGNLVVYFSWSTDSTLPAGSLNERFATRVPPRPCGAYTRNWLPAQRFRGPGRYTITLRARDTSGLTSARCSSDVPPLGPKCYRGPCRATGVSFETVVTLTFTIPPELDFAKTVEDGTEQDELESFARGDAPYSGAWIEVDGGRLIRRDAVVSVHIAEPGEVTYGLGVIE
jgi:hypothetical protein